MSAGPAFAPAAPPPRCGVCRGARALSARRRPAPWAVSAAPRARRALVLCTGTRAGAAAAAGEEDGRRARCAQRWGAGVLAALALALCGAPGCARAAAEGRAANGGAAGKELRYDGRTELGGTEKMLSLALTGGAFAGLSMWAWRRNREDDELEQVRIREEVERLEKLKAEFMDVEEDDDSLDDEDLLKELTKRLEKDAGEEGEGADGDAPQGDADITAAAADNSADGEGEDAGSESLDMLRRMWEATDDEKKDGEGEGPAPAAGH